MNLPRLTSMIDLELPATDREPESRAGVPCSLPNCRRADSPVTACKCACSGRNHGTRNTPVPFRGER